MLYLNLRSYMESIQKDLTTWSYCKTRCREVNCCGTLVYKALYQSNLPDFNSLKVNCYQNFEISSKNSIKYLGIIIDRHLRWDEHMRNVCHIKQLNIMYFALIQSHLIYGIIGWGRETAQKWTIKIMHNKNYTYPSEELYKEAKILDLRQLYARSLLLRQYKLKPNINMYPNYNYDTRNKETMKFPKTAKTCAISRICNLSLKDNENPYQSSVIHSTKLDFEIIGHISEVKPVWLKAKKRMNYGFSRVVCINNKKLTLINDINDGEHHPLVRNRGPYGSWGWVFHVSERTLVKVCKLNKEKIPCESLIVGKGLSTIGSGGFNL
ncbi:hypothetical protein NQ317_005870 [Molorchus minor]|uniref:Uncharacterized protein n=1 Tax=Molorchus minor TaxID=1323400 RepID=A0ABQ9K1L7_9CUCU|nr:hypothetical protein NQ317_005870 [Molorchus minor]